MRTNSSSQIEAERLLSLLQTYDRDEVWLRVRQVYQLLSQPDQAWFDVVDATGIELADRFGRFRSHTVQVRSPWASLQSGQLVHVSRSGREVWVQIPPLLQVNSSSEPAVASAELWAE